VLTNLEREKLRAEIDRKRRETIGNRLADKDEWVGFPDASRILGVCDDELRVRARARGLYLRRWSGHSKIRVTDLDLLR
jgi:hypothetical protein